MTNSVAPSTQQARRSSGSVGTLERLGLTVEGLRTELLEAGRAIDGTTGKVRYGLDALGYRLQRVLPVSSRRRREVILKDGTVLTYRFNRGDVRAIAEVWLSEAYRLPFTPQLRNVVDFGANIGMASLWLARRYGNPRVIGVEPVAESAQVARINLERNGVPGEVLQAAIGPEAGTALFETNPNSTLGHLGDNGVEVPVTTPQAVIDRFAPNVPIDLVKIDIEGGEQALFDGDLGWLERVECVLMELHSDRVDASGITAKLCSHGFSYVEIGHHSRYGAPTDITGLYRRSR